MLKLRLHSNRPALDPPGIQGLNLKKIDLESFLCQNGFMKTSLDIPEKELRDVMRFTKAKTKREAIVTAIIDYNRRQHLASLVKHFGTFDSLLTNEEIEALEEKEQA